LTIIGADDLNKKQFRFQTELQAGTGYFETVKRVPSEIRLLTNGFSPGYLTVSTSKRTLGRPGLNPTHSQTKGAS